MEKEAVDPLIHVSSIKDFCIGRLIGKGAFGNVFLSTLKSSVDEYPTSKKFAIKIVKKSLINTQKLAIRIKNEIRIHLAVRHENIVKLFRVFQDKKNFYLVLEYCEKGELFRYLKKRKRFSVDEARDFFSQIVHGVRYLHKKGIIHRDLKLSNIMLTKDNRIKIGDFGLSTRLTRSDERRMTQLGTPDYVAPEILKKKPHGFEVDIWSMGCILYAFFVGHPPFHSQDIRKTLLKIRRNQFKILPKHRVPRDAADLILMLLQPDDKRRLSLQQVRDHPFLYSREEIEDIASFETRKRKVVRDSSAANERRSRYIRGGNGGVVRMMVNHRNNMDMLKKSTSCDDYEPKNIVDTIRTQKRFEYSPICLDRLKMPYLHKTKNGCVEVRNDSVIFWYRTTKFQVFPSLQTVRIVSNLSNTNSRINDDDDIHNHDNNNVVVKEYKPIATLPERYWKYYQYVSEFVSVVRSRTVKLRILVYSKKSDDGIINLKCCVMENTPPDIDCDFGEGLGRATFVARDGTVRLGREVDSHGRNIKNKTSMGMGKEKITKMVLWWKDKAMSMVKQMERQGRKDYPITVIIRGGKLGIRKKEEEHMQPPTFSNRKRKLEDYEVSDYLPESGYSGSSVASIKSAPGALKSFDSRVMAKYLTKTDSTSLEMKRLYSI